MSSPHSPSYTTLSLPPCITSILPVSSTRGYMTGQLETKSVASSSLALPLCHFYGNLFQWLYKSAETYQLCTIRIYLNWGGSFSKYRKVMDWACAIFGSIKARRKGRREWRSEHLSNCDTIPFRKDRPRMIRTLFLQLSHKHFLKFLFCIPGFNANCPHNRGSQW